MWIFTQYVDQVYFCICYYLFLNKNWYASLPKNSTHGTKQYEITCIIAPADPTTKQLGCFASLNHNIDIAADSTPGPVDANHAAHAGGPTMCIQLMMTTHLL